MAELTTQERLQPSLLDRLTDDDPGNSKEARDQRVLSLRKLRDSVKRDLAWLFNTTHLEVVQSLNAYPQVISSVINFGIPEFSGHTLHNVEPMDIERQIKQAVINFEPRILPQTIKIRLYKDEEEMSHNALSFEIEGMLWAQPTPLQLYLKTEIDLDLGDVQVTEYG